MFCKNSSFYFFVCRWNGTWISDTTFFYLDANDSIYTYNCDTLRDELLIRKNIIQHNYMNQSLVSPTAKYVLIPKAQDKVCCKQNTNERICLI